MDINKYKTEQPMFLTMAALSSQKYPLVAGVAGFVVCLGRLAYAAGIICVCYILLIT